MSPRARLGTARSIAFAVLALDLLLAAAAARYVLLERRDRFSDAERATENLARVLGESLEGVVRLIDLALEEAKAEIELQRSRKAFSDAELEGTLARLHAKVGFLDGIRTANALGRIEHGVAAPKGAPVEIGDRDYFIRARDDLNAGLIVSAPLVSRVTGKRSLVFARRTQHRDGSFGGVVYAVVLIEQLTRTFARVNVGSDGTVALRDKDLVLIARLPEESGGVSTIGQKAVSPALQAILDAGTDDATFVTVSPVDNLEKVNAYRRVSGGSFHLIVASTVERFLADWRSTAIRTAAVVLLFVLLTALGARLLLRYWSQESESRFRELIEMAPIAMALTHGAKVAYVNREFVRELGLRDGEQAVGRSLLEGVAPEDAARTVERVERRMRAEPVEPTIEITLRRRDGSRFKASVTDATVEADGRTTVVAFIQDVTVRRRSEEERERLIAELKRALAEVKTLSGLLPICAHCKMIRDDRGYWNRIETFIRDRSSAEFTHGICPDCAMKHFPEGGSEEQP